MAFNDAAVAALLKAAPDRARQLGVFDRVQGHEPKSSPGTGLSCAFAVAGIRPEKRVSGLAETGGVVELSARVYLGGSYRPEDGTDPKVLAAVSALIGAFSDDFTLGGTVFAVDLLGAYGTALSARMGWLESDGKQSRVADVTIPVAIDNLWIQGAQA